MNKPVETHTLLDPAELVVDQPSDGTFLVSRRLFNDAELFELEMKYIFENTWLFLCHEGQIPNAGDFFTTEMGRQPVVISRGKDGKVYGFVNACAHRGATLCRTRRGNQQFHTCPYHGWVYDSTGRCVNIDAEPRGGYPDYFAGLSHDLRTPLSRIRLALELADAYNVAALHRPVVLGASQRVAAAGHPYLQAAAEPGGIAGAQAVGVEASASGDPAGLGAPAIAEGDSDSILGVTRHNPDWHGQGPALVAQLD